MVLEIISLAAIVYRIIRRQLSRAEWITVGVVVIAVSMIFVQCLVCDHSLPERRYWNQAMLLTYPWGIWAIGRLGSFRGFTAMRFILVLLAGFVVYDLAYLIRVCIPGARRQIFIEACDWAVERIRSDWDGPERSEGDVFLLDNYYTPYRPYVTAHTSRVGYLVNGSRYKSRMKKLGINCDYWFDQVFDKQHPPAGYEQIGIFKRGKYRFELHRRPKDQLVERLRD